jgi:dihydrofolate synthase/folylpolyglutamate synthase
MHRLADHMNVKNGGGRSFIHIAGTNGKGSTTAIVESMLRLAGYKTGACFSPFVYDVRERVQITGELISEQKFLEGVEVVRSATDSVVAERFGDPTVFELFSALAFWAWEDAACDVAVVEVGLGGRLDCTNIIESQVGAITSIGFDHMSVLGDSLAEIAAEKAGILRPARPCFVGDLPQEARDVVRQEARRVGADAQLMNEDWSVQADRDSAEFKLSCRFGEFVLPRPRRLPGPVQTVNAAIAGQCFLAFTDGAMDRDQQVAAMERGLREAFLPGRFEVIRARERTWILDGSHNEQAIGELVRTYRQQYPGLRPTVLFGMLQSHDPGAVLDQLSLLGGPIFAVPIGWDLAFDPHELADRHGLAGWFGDLESAVAWVESDVVLVCGSYYLLTDFRPLLD